MNRYRGGKRPQLGKLSFIALQVLIAQTSNVYAFTQGSISSLTGPQRSITGKLQPDLIVRSKILSMSSGTHEDTHESSVNQSAAASQNVFGVVSDAVTGLIFSFLHAFDDCEIKDSSKNLRVLWVRALLNYKNKIDDPVAQELLPKTTRGLVTSKQGASVLDPILKFAEWIQSRTEFIDDGLNNFLSSPAC